MKNIIQFVILFAVVFSACKTSKKALANSKVKEGVVKFEMSMDGAEDNPEMAMLGNMNLDFYFSKTYQRMDMSMMAGMMRIQTYVPAEKPEDGSLLVDMLGQKYQIIEMGEEEISQTNNFTNMENVKEVKYDEKDTKEILGYQCYRAFITLNDGQSMKYYITEKIQFPQNSTTIKTEVLKGYPLEMEVDTGQGMVMNLVATEVLESLPEGAFTIPEGYTKMTMEEFEETMGDMDLGF